MTQPLRRLVWTPHALANLDEVVAVLSVINPKGHSAEHIRAAVNREFDAGLDSYMGTAGWYVTVYNTKLPSEGGAEIWHAVPTIMAYSVKRYLDEVVSNLGKRAKLDRLEAILGPDQDLPTIKG